MKHLCVVGRCVAVVTSVAAAVGCQTDRTEPAGRMTSPAATATTQGVQASSNQPLPEYSVPYKVPTAESVTQVLERVRGRLEKNLVARVVDSKTKGEVTDFATPREGLTMDRGPANMFPAIAYPTGVINSGLLAASQATGDKRYGEITARQYEFFARHYEALAKWPNDRSNPFRTFHKPTNLDSCGAMGAAMVRAKRMGVGPDLSKIYDRWAEYVMRGQFRIADGTLARNTPFPKSLWLDDAYMSVPLLAQYGALTGKGEYFDEAAKQIKLFHKHLFVPEKGVFTHAGNLQVGGEHPHYFWGRANGWFMVATVELLDLLPEKHADRAELIRILQAHAKGIANLQSGTGLWHQLLDRTDSYLETSCTAMFSYAMAKGANRGWLNAAAYAPVAVAGWNGLQTKIKADGSLRDVCVGTNYADDFIYYYHRPATDDFHGYGPVLLCGAEMINLVKNPAVKLGGSGSGPILVDVKARE